MLKFNALLHSMYVPSLTRTHRCIRRTVASDVRGSCARSSGASCTATHPATTRIPRGAPAPATSRNRLSASTRPGPRGHRAARPAATMPCSSAPATCSIPRTLGSVRTGSRSGNVISCLACWANRAGPVCDPGANGGAVVRRR